MAVTHFAFGFAADKPQTIIGVTAYETKAPSSSSSATTAAATASAKGTAHICRVSTDTAVYVAFGASPTASATTGFYMPANSVDYFSINVGDKAAVKTP